MLVSPNRAGAGGLQEAGEERAGAGGGLQEAGAVDAILRAVKGRARAHRKAPRRASKSEMPSSRQTTASPSIRNDLRSDCAGGLDDRREAIGPIMAAPRPQANPRALPAHHDAESIVFGLMNPEWTGRRLDRLRRSAGFNKSGRPAALRSRNNMARK